MSSKSSARSSGIQDLLVAESVGKRFDTGVVALEDINLTVSPQRFVSVVGPSGCGKSTLLRLVAGLTQPTSGELTLHGSRITGPRRDTGMMFQQPTLLAWKTALENVLLPRVVAGAVGDDDVVRAHSYLELTGIESFAHAYPRHLSGGMQQRVALARLLMVGADVLLLDEPFGALDEFTRERLNLELARIHTEVGATSMFVTHNITEAVFLADEVLVMTPRPGRLAGVLDVPFERPRMIELLATPEFNAITTQIRQLLGAGA